MRPRTIAIAVLALALLAGGAVVVLAPGAVPLGDDGSGGSDAAQPTTPANGPPSSPYDPDVEVRGGELGVDASAYFGWTLAAMNRTPAEIDAPTVEIGTIGGAGHPLADQPFQQLLILEDPDGPLPERQGTAVARRGSVQINEDRLPALRDGEDGLTIEHILVHEFTHIVQRQTAFVRLPLRESSEQSEPLRSTRDRLIAWQAVVEGGAEFVANDYTDGAVLERWNRRWPEMNATERLIRWPYYRGAQWSTAQFEEPADMLDLEERPHRTVTVLRREPPAADPPTISLSSRLPDARTLDEASLGAVTVDVALSRELDTDRTRAVATGLSTDEYRHFDLEGTADSGHVWVLQFRNRSAASAFERAMGDYLDARGERADDRWSDVAERSFALEREDPRTVSVVAGPRGFVDRATIAGSDGEYSVEEAESRPSIGGPSPSTTRGAADGSPAITG